MPHSLLIYLHPLPPTYKGSELKGAQDTDEGSVSGHEVGLPGTMPPARASAEAPSTGAYSALFSLKLSFILSFFLYKSNTSHRKIIKEKILITHLRPEKINVKILVCIYIYYIFMHIYVLLLFMKMAAYHAYNIFYSICHINKFWQYYNNYRSLYHINVPKFIAQFPTAGHYNDV